MSETTIEWCRWTFNYWEGCQGTSPGCDNCYAEARNARFGGGTAPNFGPGKPRRLLSEVTRRQPYKWDKLAETERSDWRAILAHYGSTEAAAKAGYKPPQRPLVFAQSLSDVFDNAVPTEWRAALFETIRATPNLEWLVLTKRVGNVERMVAEAGGWPDNARLGISVCSQAEADRDIPRVIELRAKLRITWVFLSMEPLLEAVNLEQACDIAEAAGWSVSGGWGEMADPIRWAAALRRGSVALLDWVITGGESGHRARPALPAWFQALRDECEEAGVPFLHKQNGTWHTTAIQMSTGQPVFRQFDTFERWVNKASSWVNGGICLDRHGRQLRNGADFERARNEGHFPVTVMHKVGANCSGRLLDGQIHNEFPGGL